MQDPFTAQPAPAESTPHGDKMEHAMDAAVPPGPDAAAVPRGPSELLDPLLQAQAEAAELKEAWVRARADLENARKQASLDVLKAHKFAVERFAEDLLPVADSLEQALSVAGATPEQLREGVELTLRQLQSAFSRAQLVPTEPAGEKFNPHHHQAMQMVESDQPANTVVQVFQKGYVLNERVLRPALVTVAKGAAAPSGAA